MADETQKQKLLRKATASFRIAPQVRNVKDSASNTLLETSNDVWPAGMIFTLYYGTPLHIRVADGLTAYTSLPRFSVPNSFRNYTLADPSGSTTPAVITDLNASGTTSIQSSSSAGAAGLPGGWTKAGMVSKVNISGDGGIIMVDVNGNRAAIVGIQGNAYTSPKQLALRAIIDSTTTAYTLATIEAAYPVATNPVGTKIICKNITGGGRIYERDSSSGWIWSAINTLL